MFTYIIMGVPFLMFVACLDVFILKTRVLKQRNTWYVMVFMVMLTLIFDQLLTGLPIVLYNESHMLGWRLGFVPIEDLTYTLAVVVLIGSLIQYDEKSPK
jgi:lycopene cyclase domain-containing protein